MPMSGEKTILKTLLVALLPVYGAVLAGKSPNQAKTSGGAPEELLREYIEALHHDEMSSLHKEFGHDEGVDEYHYFDLKRGVSYEAKEVLRRAVEQYPSHPTTDLMIRHARLLSDRDNVRLVPKVDQLLQLPGPRNAGVNSKRLFLRTYKVADLVTPGPPMKSVPAGDSVQPNKQATEKPDFETLLDLITSTIQPETWERVGGAGSITPVEADLSLVVRQTDSVHEEISDVLDELRRLGRIRLTLDVRFINAPDEAITPRLQGKGARFDSPSSYVPKEERLEILGLLPPQAEKLQTAVQEDPHSQLSVLPSISLRNGERAQVRDPARNTDSPGAAVIVQAVTSGDCRKMRVQLKTADRSAFVEVPDEPLDCIGISGGVTLVADVAPPQNPDKASEKQPVALDSTQEHDGIATMRPANIRTLVLVTLRVVENLDVRQKH